MATKLELTILSDPLQFQTAVGSDDDGNLWVYIECNGKNIELPLDLLDAVNAKVNEFIGPIPDGDLS